MHFFSYHFFVKLTTEEEEKEAFQRYQIGIDEFCCRCRGVHHNRLRFLLNAAGRHCLLLCVVRTLALTVY